MLSKLRLAPLNFLLSAFAAVTRVVGLVLICLLPLHAVGNEPTSSSNTEQAKSRPPLSANSDEDHSATSDTRGEQTLDLDRAARIDGLITMYRQGKHLYAELNATHYRDEFIVLISIARGIGRDPLYGGMTWGTGDDWVWQFRKVDGRVLIVRRNVRFRADKGSPAATAIKYAYTDSVLFSEPLLGKGPQGGDLVDLTPIFMSDLPQIAQVLPNFYFAAQKSTWAEVKGFDDNVEIEVAATYASSGRAQFDSVADSRGVTIHVHYSISKIKPGGGYQPRLADDRVGYFLTVVKDYSRQEDRDRFVRYINRWRLEKADPTAAISPPKKPLVFWLENTIPYEYRPTIREGILEWNKAFEKAGFADAIEVRQQPDAADWDAEDVNYNTFRWITSGAGFAMGPSRVNPYTGQILDADIIFDADFLQYWQQEFESLTPKSVAEMTGGPLNYDDYLRTLRAGWQSESQFLSSCSRRQSIARQFAFGRTALQSIRDTKTSAEEMAEMIRQGLKGTVMHEVGHTLGLKHNFKSSAWLSLDELNEASEGQPLLASVMDYDAVNITPDPAHQGQYFTGAIGPYDVWAIEYGYRQFDSREKEELAKIASRSGEPALQYASDEDSRGFDVDPLANRWDLGKDPLQFAARQADLVRQLAANVVERTTGDGEDYALSRQAFNVLLSTQGQAMFFAARLVGGIETSRSHKGDANAPAPLTVVAADRQRAALQLLSDRVFGAQPFDVPPAVYNYLIGSRWVHWGAQPTARRDYPIHDVILMWQERILDYLLSSTTLTRIHDHERAVMEEEDYFTAAELIAELTESVFAEVLASKFEQKSYTTRDPAIDSVRRNLQRAFMKSLAQMAMGNSGAPEDCQTVAYLQLQRLQAGIERVLREQASLDDYSKAHLRETADRIQRVLKARLVQYRP